MRDNQERQYDLKQVRALAGQAQNKSGLTQKETAKLLHIHEVTYQHLEQNPGNLRLNQAYILAEAAGIGVEQIRC